MTTCLLLAACGGGSSDGATTTPPVADPAPAPDPAPDPDPDPAPADPKPTPPTTISGLGVNLSAPNYYMQDRALMNLAQGAGWGSQRKGVAGSTNFDPARLDVDGNVTSLESGELAFMLLVPPEASMGSSPVRIRCTWAGKGTLAPGGSASGTVQGANSFEFDWAPSGSPKAKSVWVSLTQTDTADPIRQIDCREKSVSATALFSADFLQQLQGYEILRFMDWQNINANAPVTWATRVTPKAQNQAGKLGASVEYMVALANQTGASPWFSMPWNADEDFIRRFAIYVRDNLAADRKVYVELSNEVWNWGFPVTLQARDEGLEMGLSTSPGDAAMYRYSQKTAWMQKIWTDVFKADPSRLVRVVSSQNANPWVAEQILKYGDTAQYVDALATAPYFGGGTFGGTRATITDLANIFGYLGTDVDATIAKAVQNKAVADRYGKRILAYEGGQHVVNSADVPMVMSINRDQRMYGLYKQYLQAWKKQVGGTMVLFNSTGPISQFGAWGMREYAGQPLSETPKRRAAMEYMGTAIP
ncbi:hypothetical protein [Sphingomonas sp. DBB INV C78]|uniref:hypothetical protein n=1 Tax=Sphingomonas sp. DBB INV C78 TaxID=3349434 RepID=UPI0036D21CF8